MNDLPDKPKLGVLINTQSGRNRAGTQALDALLASRPDILAQRPAQVSATAAALAALAAQGVNVVVICGGDGTVQQVLNILLSPQTPFAQIPVLAALPGGTTNMIAHDLNEANRPATAFASILKHLDTGTLPSRLTTRPIIRLTGGDAIAPAFGLFFGAAGIYEATLKSRKGADHLGIRDGFGPAIQIAAVLCKVATGRDPFAPTSMQITINGKSLGQKPVVALLLSTMERLSLGLRPFWGSGAGSMRLTMVFAPSRSLLRAIWLALKSQPHPLLAPANGYDSVNADQMELAFDGNCVLDGETFHVSMAQPVLLQNAGSLRFLRG